VHINSREYIPPTPIDFLFVDGATDRVTDVEHFLPFMSPGATIIMHDMGYSPYMEQLPRVYEVCGGQHIYYDNTPRGFLITRLDK
jgi:hypothetical protein